MKTFNLFLAGLLSALAGCASLPGTQVSDNGEGRIEYAQSGSGRPAVVFETGFGSDMDSWRTVLEETSRFTTTFAYNRPGYGGSDATERTRDPQTVVEELRRLLRERGLDAPYVLVGHSLGGLYMQYFARRYPEEVAGLVLVDATHPRQLDFIRDKAPDDYKILRFMTSLFAGTLRREFDDSVRAGAQIEALAPMVGKPVVILTATKPNAFESQKFAEVKAEMQRDLARQFPGSRQVLVASGHFIQREAPADVVAAIRSVSGK